MTLKPFDDHDVTQCAVKITRAGDGLSSALDAAPVEMHIGDTAFIVLQCKVTAVDHRPTKTSEDVYVRIHTLQTAFGTLVDQAAVRKTLDAARRNVERAQGVQRLPGTDDDDE